MNTEITGAALKVWRETHNKNLDEVGQMLGGVSGPTISRWESGQDIPGPAQLLLGMLIHGKQPFGASEDTSAEEAKHFWQLKLTLGDWHKLEALATAGGFGTVRDYLLSLIQEHLNQGAETPKPLFSGHGQDVLIKPEGCAPILPSVSTAISSATGRKAPSPHSSGATIVPLPTQHWSGSAGDGQAPAEKVAETPETPVVSEERRPVVYETPKRGRKAE